MIEFIPLASSSDGCCYVVRSSAHPPLLIDAGIRYTAIQIGLNFQVTSLAGCLISHCHGDHSKAIPKLLAAGVDVYASPDTWKALGHRKGMTTHRSKPIGDPQLEKDGIHQAIAVGPWTVQPFDAVHDVAGTLGFLIASPCQCRLLYLTDTAYSRYRFEGLTHIAVEANFSSEIMRQNSRQGSIETDRFKRTTQTHMSLERLIEMLKANDLNKVKEIHLLHLSDLNSDEAAFKDAVQRATGIPVFIACKRQTPTGRGI